MRPRIESYLRQQGGEIRRNEYIASLREQTSHKITLDPPRTDVAIPGEAPVKGPGDAPITLVEFADFQCPYCKQVHPVVERVLLEYGDQIRFAFMDFPLVDHPRAMPASIASYCAAEQDKYWPYYQNLMVMAGDLGDTDLRKRATETGLDIAKFGDCYESRRYADQVQASFEHGKSLGVTGTPTFFLNGRMLVGAIRYEDFKQAIEEELEKAGLGSDPNVGG